MEGCLEEESFQMWELNRRLEAYLARVKALEEQNEMLSAELRGLRRARSGDVSWRARADEELVALRALLEERWREKQAAEVARDNLAAEAEGVMGRWQKQREARERTEAVVACSRRALEDEQRAHAWLRAQVAELEAELEARRAAHDEERAGLNARVVACVPRCPAMPSAPSVPTPELEELARRLGEAWQGAVRDYQERVADLEASLGQARERLGQAVQSSREGRLELQQLRTERGGLLERKAALEQRVDGQWQERLKATEKFQLSVEALEQEKESLQKQIAQILEGRQQLAHLKMSLSLEVATYRTLLEAENGRLQPTGAGSKAALSFPGPKLELHFPGTPGGRHVGGPLPSILSPSVLSSPLPDTLNTPVPTFLKSQEFLQARTPTLASTPIPPTPQVSCPPAAETVLRDAPLSPSPKLQPQVGRQQALEAPQVDTKPAIPASFLTGPEEPGGEQQEARSGPSPPDSNSMASPLSLDIPSVEAKEEEPSGFSVPSRIQEEGEGLVWELAEKETALEVQRVSSLQQEVWQNKGDLGLKETQEPGEETAGSLEQEIQEPLVGKQDHETLSLEEEDQEPLRVSEDPCKTLRDLDTDNWEPLTSLEEKDGESSSGEKGTLAFHLSSENEAPQKLLSLDEDQEGTRSHEDDLETLWGPGKEKQDFVGSLQTENQESLRALQEGSQERLSCQEVENEQAVLPAAKENEPPKSLEEVEQKISGPLGVEEQDLETWAAQEKEEQEQLRSPDEEKQQVWETPENETQEPQRILGDEDQAMRMEMTVSPGEDAEPLNPLEKVTQELWSQEEASVETERATETEMQGLLGSEREENPQTVLSPETQESKWSLEELSQETVKPEEKEVQDPLGSVEKKQEPQSALDQQDEEPQKLQAEGGSEALSSPEESEEEGAQGLEEKVTPEQREGLGSPMCPEEEPPLPAAQNLQRWEEMGGEEEEATGRAGVDSENGAELDQREGLAGKESMEQKELPMPATEGPWNTEEGHLGSPGPEEQPTQEAHQEGGTEGPPSGPLDLAAPEGLSEDMGPEWANEEVTWEAEAAVGETAVGAEQEQELRDLGLGDASHQAKEEAEEKSLEGKRVPDLEEPREDLGAAAALEPRSSLLLGKGWDPTDTPEGWEESIPIGQELGDVPQSGFTGFEAVQETAKAGSMELLSPTEVPQDSLGPQTWAEGEQEACGGLEGKNEDDLEVGSELGSGGLLEEREDSGDESEADELGETLPDSTPLSLHLGSQASPHWGLAGEQMPSPLRDDQLPVVLAHQNLGSQPWEEVQQEKDEEEEGGCGSELAEDFEDLATEASLHPGIPRDPTDPESQAPLPEPAAWEGNESDGFADEEESGEEGDEESGEEDSEEEGEEEVDQREPRASDGGPERGSPLESGGLDMGVPGETGWGDAETSDSEQDSDPAPSGRAPQLLKVGQVDLEAGVPLGVNGQGTSLQEELEHVNGSAMNGLELSKEGNQGKLGTSPGDHPGSPLEEAGSTLKTPWTGTPLHLGPRQFLQFTQREEDGDSWSSGED
ncbi:nestin [Suncus etruscus]|uniref:nestin n=1 Tax=Suncus etruscus TaxID=109475 RepID=UPI00210FB2D4|nr:nestin [Suncus etruscus]